MLSADAVSSLYEDAKSKREFRDRLRMLRHALPAEERAAADAAIAELLLSSSEFQRAGVVLAYLSVGDEVDTRAIIRGAWERGKVVAIPRCVPGTRCMEWFAVESFDGLVRSRFGLEEPDPARARRLDVGALDHASVLALVPGLVFDVRGSRLGYGGGYYDVFLESFAGLSVGLCREAFLLDSLEAFSEPHDQRVDGVITQIALRITSLPRE